MALEHWCCVGDQFGTQFFFAGKKILVERKTFTRMNGRQRARPVALPVARRWSELHIRTPNTFLLAFSLPAGATFGKWKASRYNGHLYFSFPCRAQQMKTQEPFRSTNKCEGYIRCFCCFQTLDDGVGERKEATITLNQKKENMGWQPQILYFFLNSTEINHWFGGWWLEQRPSTRRRRFVG